MAVLRADECQLQLAGKLREPKSCAGLGIVQRLNSLNSTLRHADPSNATEITVTFLHSLHAEACLW
jgi:hypothetical protein